MSGSAGEFHATGPVRRRMSFAWITTVMSLFGTLIIFAVMLTLVTDITARYLFNSPIRGVTEMVSMSITVIVFLQLGAVVKDQVLTRIEMFPIFLHKQSRPLAMLLSAITNLAGAGFFALIVTAVWPDLLQAYYRGLYYGTMGFFTFPAWPVRLIIIVGAATGTVHFLLHAARDIYQGFTARTRP